MFHRTKVFARDLRPGDVLGRNPVTGEKTTVEFTEARRGEITAVTSTGNVMVCPEDRVVRIDRHAGGLQ